MWYVWQEKARSRMNKVVIVFLGAGVLAGCLSVDDGAANKIVVREVAPEAGVKVIDTSMEVRYYPMPTVFLERISCCLKEKTSEIVSVELERNRDWKKFFADFDVLWPEGSSLVYLQNSGKLRVRNTAENHELIEKALNDLSEGDQMLEVCVEFLSVDQKTLDAVGRECVKGKPMNVRYVLSDFDGVASGELRARLVGDRSVKIVSSSRVLTRSGENAVAKNVVECLYPQDYDVSLGEMVRNSTNDSWQVKQAGLAAVEPQNFTMREVGTVLDVTPEALEGDYVMLNLKPQYTGEPEWKDFGMRPPAPNGGTYALPMKQPFFPVLSTDSKLRLKLDTYSLVGSSRIAPDDGKEGPLCLVFARVRLVDAAAK